MGEKLASMRKSKTEQPAIEGVTFFTGTIGSPSNPVIPSVGDIYLMQPPESQQAYLYFKPTNISSVVLITKNWYNSRYYNRVYLIETDSSGSYINPYRINKATENVSGEVNEIYTFSSSDKTKPFRIRADDGNNSKTNPRFTLEVIFK